MNIYLLPHDGGNRRRARPPCSDADHAVVDGACPNCDAAPFKVQGTGRRIANDDRAYEADGVAMCCGTHVGIIRAEVSTIFGLREDEAVMQGRCRVY